VGEEEGGRDLLKVGLFCVGDVDEICGGLVGKGDGNGGGAIRFCTRLRGECRYAIHRESKAMIEDQTYYIKTPRAHTARLHPSLSMMCLQLPTEDNNAGLEHRLQTMDVWVTYLNAINAHKAMNLAGQMAAKETAKRSFAVTGMEEEDDDDGNVTPTDSTWVRVFALLSFGMWLDLKLPAILFDNESALKMRILCPTKIVMDLPILTVLTLNPSRAF
jgi:hypothetical protein